MAEKCQHTDGGIPCDCPHFVGRQNLTSTEVNTCDGCLHTIAWHRIPVQEPINSASFTSTTPNSTALSVMVDEILASFASQSQPASISGEMRAQKRGKRKERKALEAEARQEAVSRLKCSVGKGAKEDPSAVRPFFHSYQFHIIM